MPMGEQHNEHITIFSYNCYSLFTARKTQNTGYNESVCISFYSHKVNTALAHLAHSWAILPTKCGASARQTGFLSGCFSSWHAASPHRKHSFSSFELTYNLRYWTTWFFAWIIISCHTYLASICLLFPTTPMHKNRDSIRKIIFGTLITMNCRWIEWIY